MICTSCGKVMNEEDNYCSYCGTALHDIAGNKQSQISDDGTNKKDTVSIKNWVGSFALIFIPYIGIIIYFVMLFVWGLSKNTNEVKRNFALSQLIIFIILVAVNILFLGSYWTEVIRMTQNMINQMDGGGIFY